MFFLFFFIAKSLNLSCFLIELISGAVHAWGSEEPRDVEGFDWDRERHPAENWQVRHHHPHHLPHHHHHHQLLDKAITISHKKRQSRESPPRQLWKLLSRKLLHIFFVISSFSFASLWFSGLGSGLSLVIWRWHWCYWAWCWCCWAWCWCYWALLGWYYWEWCWCYWAWFWCYSALFWCFWKRCWCYWGWLHLMHLSGDRPIHCLQNPAWAWHDSHTEVNIYQMHTCIGTFFLDVEIHL